MFRKLIKIPGKASFRDLTVSEVALMIEADSSLQRERSEHFDSCALDEFIHCSNLSGRPDLEEIRDHIAQNIYIDVPGSTTKEINVEFLVRYAGNLRSRGDHAL
jgi:hypothetical protein